jgi:hypothetical protein
MGEGDEATLNADASSQTRTKTLLRIGECGIDCIIFGKTGAMLPINDSGFFAQRR